MKPPTLSEFIQLAEVLLQIGQRDDVEQVLERLDGDEISLQEAVLELRGLAPRSGNATKFPAFSSRMH